MRAPTERPRGTRQARRPEAPPGPATIKYFSPHVCASIAHWTKGSIDIYLILIKAVESVVYTVLSKKPATIDIEAVII